MGAQRTIDSLTGLRAVAALWVVVNHFEPALMTLFPALRIVEPIIGRGWLGVEIFFVLSGFVIAHNYVARLATPDRAALRSFWAARVARIYPVHLVTLLATGVLVVGAAVAGLTLSSGANYSPGNVLGNVLMAQALPGFRGINWPSWSVSCEAAAYLVFPLLALWLARLSARHALVSAIACVALGVVGMQLYGLAAGTWAQLDYPVMWLRIATEFTAGALLWVWWHHAGRTGRCGDVWAVASVAVGVVVLYLTGREAPATFLVLPLIAVFVVAAASASGPLATVLSSKALRWGGKVSYSLYMVHFLVFLVAKKLVGWDGFAGSPLAVRLLVVAALVGLILVAVCATYYLVEEPGRRLLRAWTTRRDLATTPAVASVGVAREPS